MHSHIYLASFPFSSIQNAAVIDMLPIILLILCFSASVETIARSIILQHCVTKRRKKRKIRSGLVTNAEANTLLYSMLYNNTYTCIYYKFARPSTEEKGDLAAAS